MSALCFISTFRREYL